MSALVPAREILAADGLVMEYSDLGRATEHVREQVREQPAGTHADEIETSMMLYIAPEVVRPELARRDIHDSKGPGGLTRDPNATRGVYSPTGSYGDPTRATREKGELVVESMVAYLIGCLESIAGREC